MLMLNWVCLQHMPSLLELRLIVSVVYLMDGCLSWTGAQKSVREKSYFHYYSSELDFLKKKEKNTHSQGNMMLPLLNIYLSVVFFIIDVILSQRPSVLMP